MYTIIIHTDNVQIMAQAYEYKYITYVM